LSVREPLGVLLTVLLWGPPALGAADPLPDEPRAAASLLLAGRLAWGASALPTGEILAPCEDQTLTVFDAVARPLAVWKASARFSAPVTVAPRAGVQLLAAPQVSGRVDVLAWDPRTRVLAAEFASTRTAEATATAWSAAGVVQMAWRDGHVEAWAPHGSMLWARDLGFSVAALLVDDSLGVYAFGPGQVALIDPDGRDAGHWTLTGNPRGVLQTTGGSLSIWTDTGLWLKGADESRFRLIDPSPRLLGVVTDRQDTLVVTEPGRVRRLTADGRMLSVTVLPRPAVTGSALDDRGRVLVGTAGGLEMWTYDGRWLATLDEAAPASAPVLTDGGLAVWSDAAWGLHIWSGFRWPPLGWPQDGGGPGRPFAAKRPASVASRAANWSDDPDFGYFYQLAASGEEAKQREVLDRFDAKAAQGKLLETWPFANVVLLKIARSGLTDLQMDHTRIVNSWPALRWRAFGLLGTTAGPEDRDELLALLRREYDPAAAVQGARALARSGWDGDGKLMHLLFDLRARMADQAAVADAVLDAARTLWLANGRSADPILLPLVSAVYQGPYPRTVKQKAQKFFQDLVEAP
jgi:hypothetical protein